MSYAEISATHPKARKEYACEWCGQKIPAGEVHLSRTYVFDGEFQSGRMHLECERAMLRSPHDEICDGWAFGSMERPAKGVGA